jgi:hypothetical protein
MQIIKFKENALEVSTPCTGTPIEYPKARTYNYVYFFLESWKYIITVLKSKYITIFNFSEFKMKTNNGDFQKKGR